MTPEQFFASIRTFQRTRQIDHLLVGLRWLFTTPLSFLVKNMEEGSVAEFVVANLDLERKDFEQIFSSADRLFSVQRYEDAALLFSLCVLTMRGTDAFSWSQLGACRLAQEKTEEAEQIFRVAVALSPEDPIYQRGLAECLAAENKPFEAQQAAFSALLYDKQTGFFSSRLNAFLSAIASSPPTLFAEASRTKKTTPN